MYTDANMYLSRFDQSWLNSRRQKDFALYSNCRTKILTLHREEACKWVEQGDKVICIRFREAWIDEKFCLNERI